MKSNAQIRSSVCHEWQGFTSMRSVYSFLGMQQGPLERFGRHANNNQRHCHSFYLQRKRSKPIPRPCRCVLYLGTICDSSHEVTLPTLQKCTVMAEKVH